MPELFTGMDVRKMDFDGRHPDGSDGVSEGDTRMGVGGGVQNDDVELPLGFLDPIDQFTFDVRLAEINPDFERVSRFANLLLDVGQGRVAVNLGLTLAEQIQVGAVQEKNLHSGEILAAHGFLSNGFAGNWRRSSTLGAQGVPQEGKSRPRQGGDKQLKLAKSLNEPGQ
jgi:hypothetical protein